jgi:hypothetical protein
MTKQIRLAALEPVAGTAAVGVKLLKLRLDDDGSILGSEPHRCVLYQDGATVAVGHHGETAPVPALAKQIEALNAGLAQMGFPPVAEDDIAKIVAVLAASAS